MLLSFQGGEKAPYGRFPYMTSIKSLTGHVHICGGILIDPQYVLTAAHCIAATSWNPYVHIGAHHVNDDEAAPGVEVP